MFQQMKNIDSAFRHIRLFSLFFIVGCTVVSLFTGYKSYQLASESQQKVFVLANGKIMEAFASDRSENIPIEAADHIKTFHHYFFTLDPDEKVIQKNITRALYLADGSAKQVYDNLKGNSYYSNIISGNISQTLEVDSVQLDINQYPYYFSCKARQLIVRPTSVVTRSLVTEGYLRAVSRSENNPHGFLIERWRTLENKDVLIQNR